ncbi:TatD family hydrolase [Roseibacillus persicicus]|uniref:TatD family hydrolase n=1 Tax=Roseibacillus persicicus TaxID=454148 RepID=UPI00280DE704|nr:TatD family hydrolase [Roseibacillus persicicus]MDQ8190281.1 TatD family hydrolase [Roseibacillus persicicus]
MIDAHNHLHQLANPGQVLKECEGSGVRHMLVNGTHENDWAAVEGLCNKHPQSLIPSFGLHPWLVGDRSPQWLERLRSHLTANPRAAVGECGLDRWKKPYDFPAQLSCLQAQLDLANELDRPLTIHCLQAWGPLLEFLQKQTQLPRFLVHAFSGSTEMMHRLAQLGAYFSFNGYFLHERKTAVRETYQAVPSERLLIESDAPAMLPPPEFLEYPLPDEQNHPANLARCLPALAEIRALPVADLEQLLAQNTHAFLGRLRIAP